jgi:hypothetical protein
MATLEELEARLAALEDRVGPAPRAVPPITIGELTDVPAPGSPIASQWTQEVSGRIFHRFATAAARNAAFTTPPKGTASYLQTNNNTEGPEFWDGVSWRKAWNMPWGVLGSALKTGDQTGFGTSIADISGLSLTVPGVPAIRQLKISLFVNFVATTGYGQFFITDAANVAVQTGAMNQAGITQSLHLTVVVATVVTGSITYKARCNTGTGNMDVKGSAVAPSLIVIEDLGPVGGAPTLLEETG